ncbi:MAG: glycosyltransferase family 87 protein [Phycisphaerae bacterium]
MRILPYSPTTNAPRQAPLPVRIAAIVGFALVMLYLVSQALPGLARQQPDFEYFYKAARWLLDHGGLDRGIDVLPDGQLVARGSIEWYLPFVSRAMTLLAWMPFEYAGGIWLTLNVVATLAVARLVGRELVDQSPRDWPVSQMLPFLFLIVFWVWEFRLNQIDTLTLLLLVSSFVLYRRGRRGVSGLWLGLAALLKLTPMLVVVWFALKREWRVVASTAIVMLAAGPLSDLIVFGPAHTGEIYSAWVNLALHGSSHRALILEQREMDWRNQGMGAVLSRWLHETNWNTHFDNEPRATDRRELRHLNIATLSRETVATIATAVAALSLAGLAWLARRPARQMSEVELRLEWALFVMAMLWFMPVMRRYHLIWLFPAISMLGAALSHAGLRERWSFLAAAAFLGLAGAQLALVAKSLTNENVTEAAGVFFWMLPIVGTAMITLLLRLRRGASAFAPPMANVATVDPRSAAASADAAPAPAIPEHA